MKDYDLDAPYEVTTRVEKIHEEDGVLCISFLPNAELTLEDGKETVNRLLEAFGGKKYLVLVDSANVKSITREAREYSAQIKDMAKALAVVSCTPAARILGNFFIDLNTPAFPTKLVASKEEGMAWLKQQAK